MKLTPNKTNEMTHAMDALVIYQNKSTDQARKEVFSRYTPEEVAAYKAAERDAERAENRHNAEGTY